MTTNEQIHAAYHVAVAACDKFHTELVRVYGAKAAGTKRYQFGPYSDAQLQAARIEFEVTNRAHMNLCLARADERVAAECKAVRS